MLVDHLEHLEQEVCRYRTVGGGGVNYVTGNGRYVRKRPGTRVDSGHAALSVNTLRETDRVNTLWETDGTWDKCEYITGNGRTRDNGDNRVRAPGFAQPSGHVGERHLRLPAFSRGEPRASPR
eukprot:654631-Prymnesium_polylepis.2